jgi:precorrin-3B synthase
MPTGDGLLVRLLPTAPISLDAFAAFCAAARRHGNGTIEITARGSFQVRGLTVDSAPAFAAEVAPLDIAASDGVPVLTNALDDDPDALIDAAALAAELRRAIADAGLVLAPKVSVVLDGGGKLHLDAVPADVRLRAIGGPMAWGAALASPSPLVGEGRGGGSGGYGNDVPHLTTPTPDPSPQGGGEKKHRIASHLRAEDGRSEEPRMLVAIAGDDPSAIVLGTIALSEAVPTVLSLLQAIAARGPSARAADLLSPLPLAGEGQGGGPRRESVPWSVPPPQPSPASGGGEDMAPSGTVAWIGTVDSAAERDVRSAHEHLRPALRPRPPAEPIGHHPLRDGSVAVGIGFPFGHANAETLADLARHAASLGARAVRPAPGRALLIGIAPERVAALKAIAARAGFIVDPADPRRRVVACPGSRACASGLIAARSLAAQLAPLLANAGGPDTLHISGCAKGCAHPAAATLTIVGTARGCGIIRNGNAQASPHRFVDPADLATEIACAMLPAHEVAHG